MLLMKEDDFKLVFIGCMGVIRYKRVDFYVSL